MEIKVNDNEICTIKNVQMLIPNISNASASRKIAELRDVLGKRKPKIITVGEFRKYFF